MRLGYCLMCGKLREVHRGVCAQCATDEYERTRRKRRLERRAAARAKKVGR